jgi:isoleucyl-tRNA synthetase
VRRRHVKDADKDIVAAVKEAGRLVDNGSLTHSYPFCWRSDTPLIYRAVPSWWGLAAKMGGCGVGMRWGAEG